MKKSRIGILLLTLAVTLSTLTFGGCVRNKDQTNSGTTTTESGSPLIPSPDATLPGTGQEAQGSTTTTTTQATNESTNHKETTTGNETQDTTTTKATTSKQESTTKETSKQESTTKATTTTKVTTTTKATTTTKTDTTTSKTTTKSDTTTKTDASTSNHTGEPPAPIVTPGSSQATQEPSGSVTIPPILTPDTSTTTQSTTSNSTTVPGHGSTTSNQGSSAGDNAAPEIGAGEWMHFEDFRDDHLGAVSYLGQSATELPVADIIAHFNLPLTAQDITVIDDGDSEDRDGDTWYLILPRHRDTVVRIREAEQTGKRTTSGELVAEGMHPMLIRCDPEDGNPALYVEMVRGEERISFPLTLEKGADMHRFHEQVLDITPKELVK